jgi:bacterioferritin-associated ferredoxin
MSNCDDTVLCLFKNVSEEQARKIIKDAAIEGAKEVLEQIGLSPKATKDIKELRQLLSSWRNIKTEAKESISMMTKSAWEKLCEWAGYALLVYLFYKLGIPFIDETKRVLH